jgi:hypothetical protein|nr:MAG TPA: hypothetical protein [Caudoviricetes sp.]
MKGLTVKDIKSIEHAVCFIRVDTYDKMLNSTSEASKENYKELIEYYNDLLYRLENLSVLS